MRAAPTPRRSRPDAAPPPRTVGAATATLPGDGRATGDDRALVDPERGFYAVADGIGGVRHGARSAQVVVDELPGLLDAADGDVAAAVSGADAALRFASRHWVGGAGTTIVCARVHDGWATVVHAGDSKAYLLRDGHLDALTTDHTLARILLDTGLAGPEDTRIRAARSCLVRHLGMTEATDPDVVRVPLRSGDRLLLCSDGVCDVRTEPELRALLQAGAPADRTCHGLLDGVRGRDDATVVIVDVA